MRRFNNYLKTGLILFALVQIGGRFFKIPDFLLGLGLGVAVSFEVFGLYLMKVDSAKRHHSKLRDYKIRLMKKILS